VGMIENLEAMLANGQDNALLRFTLGSALFKEGAAARAAEHLQMAVKLDPDYSAAWKVYGKVLQSLDKQEAACRAFETGISIATQKGDVQAAKEMTIFLKRVQKAIGAKTDGGDRDFPD
jgi:Tfp pilus assembly protein PilF